MFPHTVTVLNCVNTNDSLVINNCVVKSTFFYNKKIISQEGKGENYANTYNCIFSSTALEKYKKTKDYNNSSSNFTLEENKTIIVKGDVHISKLEELDNLDNWFYVKTIADNSDYGDDELRNIEVTN